MTDVMLPLARTVTLLAAPPTVTLPIGFSAALNARLEATTESVMVPLTATLPIESASMLAAMLPPTATFLTAPATSTFCVRSPRAVSVSSAGAVIVARPDCPATNELAVTDFSGAAGGDGGAGGVAERDGAGPVAGGAAERDRRVGGVAEVELADRAGRR